MKLELWLVKQISLLSIYGAQSAVMSAKIVTKIVIDLGLAFRGPQIKIVRL